MNLSCLENRCVWISGGSSGIGLELALLAAQSGARLALLASRPDPLIEAVARCQKAGAKEVWHFAVDLGEKSATVEAVNSLLKLSGTPDYLILNAGISQRAMAADTALEVTERLLAVNFMGAVAITKTVLPAMLQAGGGKIGVTSSLVGVHGFPLRSSYSASKHALHGYFESVFLEYRKQGICVTMGIGGRIRTGISRRSLRGDGSAYGLMDDTLQRGSDPHQVAKKYWHALSRGRREILLGGPETLSALIHRFFPRLFFFLIGRAKIT